MAFADDIARHAEQIKQRLPYIRGEESTKHALVIPLLQVLGYDVFNPLEVQPEFVADFARKKTAGQMEKIDYAIFLNGVPVIFIECKAADAKLDTHDGQLARYFNATPSVRVAILTNGVRLRVFGDLQQANVMDPAPWLDVDLLAPKAAEIDALRRFRKVDFSGDEIMSLAEEMVYFNAMTGFLAMQLREPSESFVRYVAGEIGAANRVTAKVVERMTPILRKAIQAAILEHVAKSFAPTPAPEPPQKEADSAIAAAATATDVDAEAARSGVVTTAEELEAFEQIAAWIREVHANAAVNYRDSKSYFTLNQGNTRKWFVRFNVQREPFWLALRHVRADEARQMAPGLDIVEEKHLGDCKVAVRSLADLSQLRTAVITAYQRELERAADDQEAASE